MFQCPKCKAKSWLWWIVFKPTGTKGFLFGRYTCKECNAVIKCKIHWLRLILRAICLGVCGGVISALTKVDWIMFIIFYIGFFFVMRSSTSFEQISDENS